MTAAGGSTSSELTAALNKACESGSMAAGGIGLIKSGRVTTLSAAGRMYEDGPDADVSTLFGVGSMVELLTAIAISRSRSIQPSAWISDYLPSLGLRDVTTEHLLSHTSGLPHVGRDEGPGGPDSLERAVDQIGGHKRRTEPGELAWATPSGYNILGRILEVFEKRSFDDFLRSEVLDAAGMAGGAPGAVDLDRVAWPVNAERGFPIRGESLGDDGSSHPSGNLFVSVQDLIGLATGLLEGFLVDGATWDRMTREHTSRHISHVSYPLVLVGTGFGFGCHVGEWNGQKVIRRPGRQQSYHATIDILPESGSALIVVANGADDRTFNDLLNRCYEALAGRGRLGREPGLESITPEISRSWSGTYVQPTTGAVIDVADVDRDLTYTEGGTTMPLYNVGHGRAIVPMSYGSAPLWFPTSKTHAPYLTLWGEPYFREEKGNWDLDQPDPFTGTYRDSFFPNDRTDLVVGFEDGQWSVTRSGSRSEATPIGDRRLASDHGLLEFDTEGLSVQVGGAAIYQRS